VPEEPLRGPAAPGRSRARVLAGHLAVALVLVLAGGLFVTSARTARGSDLRGDTTDLRSLVVAQQRRVALQDREVARLRQDVEQLTDQVQDPAVQALQRDGDRVAAAAGARPVSGPGVVVTLDDAHPTRPLGDEVDADSLVVHQQDLQAVVNALWAGGAQAVSLQGQRVISTSAVRCVGNVLKLQGRLYAPPYTVVAVGDPERMTGALRASEPVQIYQQYVAAYGLGWSEPTAAEVDVPAWTGSLQLTHARVLPAAGSGA
jgi:uncharacterized protein YlxW (UPF0749 family)